MGQMKQRSDYKVGDGYLIMAIKKTKKTHQVLAVNALPEQLWSYKSDFSLYGMELKHKSWKQIMFCCMLII